MGHSHEPTREEMVRFVLERSELPGACETVDAFHAVGRVLLRDVHAVNTLPNRDSSSMDGIAYRFENYRRSGGDCSRWIEGWDFCFSSAGVAIPSGFDTVTLMEDVSFDGKGRLRILRPPSSIGDHVVPSGSSMRAGQLLIAAGTVLCPTHLGLMAAAGVRSVDVFRRPLVGVVPTGDELVPAMVPLQDGRNVESNSVLFGAMIEQWGAEPVIWPIIPDDVDYLSSVVRQAVEACDIVILNAGSSKGRKDHAIEVLEGLGEVLVHEVAHEPGKHTSFTIAFDGTPIVGLVGPSGGAELGAEWYVRPLVDKCLRRPTPAPDTLKVTLLERASSPVDIDFFMGVVVYRLEDGSHVARPLGGSGRGPRFTGDGIVANATLRIPGGEVYEAGSEAEVELREPIERLPLI